MRIFRSLGMMFFLVASVACSVEVPFSGSIDIHLDPVSGTATQNKTIVITEADIRAGLESSEYALSEFDDLVLNSATASAPEGEGWGRFSSLQVVFRNDSLQHTVFNRTSFVDGSPYDHPLSLTDDILLSFFQGRSFFVDISAVLKDAPPQIVRLRVRGRLIRNLP